MTDWVGQQIGNYRLTRLLGEGSFAQVYLGLHIHLQSEAAIKLLRAEKATAGEIERFRLEASTIARLHHPHIVRVLDFDIASGVLFFVMEYASNGSLRTRHPKGTRLPPEVVLAYMKPAAEALQYAHEQRVVHRDVKPENMLVGAKGKVLLGLWYRHHCPHLALLANRRDCWHPDVYGAGANPGEAAPGQRSIRARHCDV
jgi:serine/threonine protein kinase